MNNEQKNNTTALAVAPRENAGGALSVGLRLNDVQAVRTFASDVAQSGILGQISATQAEVSLVAMRDEGLSIVQFKQKHQWVGNELSTRPNWMLGEFKRRGGKVHIKQADREACEIEFAHWDGEKLTVRITMDEMKKTTVPFAKDGKTLKSNWANFADDMLFARVCGKGLRRICPEVFCGMYTDGEAADFERAPSAPSAPVPAQGVASPSPIAEAAAPQVDPNVCPRGKVKGKRWEDLATDVIEKVIETDAAKPFLTDAHRECIKAVLMERAEREAANEQSAVEAEAEVVEVAE